MLWAWMEGDKIREIAQGDPATTYTPDIAKNFNVQVPDDAAAGDTWDGKELVKPVRREPKPVEVVKVAPGYTLDFTAKEKALYTLFASMLEAARKA